MNQLELPTGFIKITPLKPNKKMKHDPWLMTRVSTPFPGIKLYFVNIQQMTFASTDYKKLNDLCDDCGVDPIRIWFEREWSQILALGGAYVL